MKQAFRSRPFLLTAATTVVSFLIVTSVIVPALREIRNLNERIHTQRRALELLYQQGQNMRTSVEEYESIQSDIPLVTSSTLALGEELNFITTLEEIAAAHNIQQVIRLDTEQASPLPTQKNMPHRRVLLRLDVQGTAMNLNALLRELETLPPYINVLTLSMSSQLKTIPQASSDESASPLLSATLTAATYWRDEKTYENKN